MKTLYGIAWLSAFTQITATAADFSTDTPGIRQTSIPGAPAPPLPTPTAKSDPGTLKGPTEGAVRLVNNLNKEITVTDDGAQASWGRVKVWFSPDIASPRPVTLITPDGRTLGFKPAFLALENRTNSEVIIIAEFTNSVIGAVVLPNSVIWSNVLGSAGPRVSIEIKYLGNGVQQNILCEDNPVTKLPGGWDPSQVALEVWSTFSDLPDTAVESRSVDLRSATDTNAAVTASDQTISLGGSAGAARIVAGGRAFTFSSGSQSSDSLPVAKNWIPIPADKPGDSAKAMLVEALDYLSAKPLLDSLPTAKKQASLGPIRKNRSELLRLYAENTGESGRERSRLAAAPNAPVRSQWLAASAQTPREPASAEAARDISLSPRTGERGSPRKMLLASKLPTSINHAPSTNFIIDFSIISAVPIPSGAISWWPAGGNSLDALTNHNHGTNYNGVLYTAGEVGQGFFLPVSLDEEPPPAAHIRITNSPSLRVTNAVTVEAWVNPQTIDSPWYRSIFSGWDYVGNHQRTFDVALNPANQAYIVVSSNGDDSGASYVLTTNAIPYDTWTHVAGVYDGSSLRFYLNGALAVTPGAYSSGILPGTNNLAIGGYVGGLAPGDPDVGSPFFGAIDEPTIYSRALSASDILAIYNAGPAGKINPNCVAASTNAIAWWPSDGNAFDIAHTNMGTLINGASFDSGVVGQAFSLNGTGAHVRMHDNPDFHVTNAITIEAWVFPRDTDAFHDIVGKWDYVYGAGQKSYDFSLYPGGQVYILVSSDGFDSGAAYVLTSNSIPPNAWTHVAGVYDGSSLNVYLNGVLDANASYSSGIYPGTNDLAVGGFCGGAPPGSVLSAFAGLIDEPTVYNRALSGTEISAIYSAGCAGKCKIFPGGDLLTDLQRSFLGLSQTNLDADGDGVPDGIEFFQGRNPKISGAVADTGNAINLQVYTPQSP